MHANEHDGQMLHDGGGRGGAKRRQRGCQFYYLVQATLALACQFS